MREILERGAEVNVEGRRTRKRSGGETSKSVGQVVAAAGRPKPSARPAGLNRSVARALDLLVDVAHIRSPVSFVDLQRNHRVPKATLHKLLFTLEALRFVRRDEDTGKYSLGLATMEVSAAGAAGPGDLAMMLRPVMRKLVEETHESCHLGILVGGEEVILSRIDPEHQVVRLALHIGRRHPAYASAGGLASLALRLDQAMFDSLPEKLPQLTENTIKTRGELLERLDQIRAQGYALDMEEAYIGVRCVGVAVATANWPVVHTSLSVPLQRGSVRRLHELAKPLMIAASEIERILAVTPRW